MDPSSDRNRPFFLGFLVLRDIMIMNKYIILLGFLPLISGCSLVENYEEDNILEEIVEEIIEYKTGISIDLSPNSLEDDDR